VTLESSLNTLMHRWSLERQLKLYPPVSRESVMATFQQFGVCATADLIYLYGCVGGMNNFDGNLWRLWPLQELVERNEEYGECNDGLLFSDYMIDAWSYRVHIVGRNEAAVYVDRFVGNERILVAKTLTEFFRKYVEMGEDFLNAF
jgi:hypothetical protein